MQWSVGDGTLINPRQDRWLASRILGGPTPSGELEKLAGFMIPNSNEWNLPLLRQHFDCHIVTEIMSIPLRPQHTKDRLI